MTARTTVEAYYAAIGAADLDAYAALFADDAIFALPDGREVEGRTAIRSLMAHVLTAAQPAPEPFAWVVSDDAAVVEARVATADGTVRMMCSVFRLDHDGRIRRLAAYRRGG